MSPLLEVTDLAVTFRTDGDPVTAVRGISYRVEPGEVVAMVGESGSGKSAAAMAVVGLLPEYAQVRGSVRLQGTELLGLADNAMSRFRGKAIGTVFQDPMSALTPVYTVGDQIAEATRCTSPVLARRPLVGVRWNCLTWSVFRSRSGVPVRFRMSFQVANANAW